MSKAYNHSIRSLVKFISVINLSTPTFITVAITSPGIKNRMNMNLSQRAKKSKIFYSSKILQDDADIERKRRILTRKQGSLRPHQPPSQQFQRAQLQSLETEVSDDIIKKKVRSKSMCLGLNILKKYCFTSFFQVYCKL